jgi:hypothetical protein
MKKPQMVGPGVKGPEMISSWYGCPQVSLGKKGPEVGPGM